MLNKEELKQKLTENKMYIYYCFTLEGHNIGGRSEIEKIKKGVIQ